MSCSVAWTEIGLLILAATLLVFRWVLDRAWGMWIARPMLRRLGRKGMQKHLWWIDPLNACLNTLKTIAIVCIMFAVGIGLILPFVVLRERP